MVARDGVEPPPPAFSDLVQPRLQLLTGLRETAKYLQIRASPSNHGLESDPESLFLVSVRSVSRFFQRALSEKTPFRMDL
jgi:hypothetical protein